MAKTNKFSYLVVLQGNYGHGWEDLTAEDKAQPGAWKRIIQSKKEYLANDSYSRGFRIVERRELNQ